MENKNNRTLTWLLVKNRLLAQSGLNVFRYEKDPKKKRNTIIMGVGIILLVGMFIFYLSATAIGYAMIGLNDLTPGLALVMSSLVALFFTILKANGELFGFPDYDLLMSLPISTRKIINSRFLNMYVRNTLLSMVVMLPMGGVYAWFAQPSLYFYPMWLIGILLASLIPTTIAAVIGALITAFATKFRYANVVATILSFVLIIGILVASLSLGSNNSDLGGLIDETGQFNLETLSTLVPMLSAGINRLYPPAALFTAGVVEGRFFSFVLFAGISLAWYALFVYLLGLYFQQINTAITSQRSRSDYQLAHLNQGSMVMALYKKTITRILKTTVVATNLLVGCVMAIIGTVSLLIVGPEKMVESLGLVGGMSIVKSAAPFLIAALASMTNTACVSLALEGKQIWVIKSLPIPPKTLYDSYLLVNLSFTVPTSLICSLLMSLGLQTNLVETLNLFVTPLILVSATAMIGILIGNRMAYYDWQEVMHLIKQSMMSMFGMLGGVIVIGIIGAVVNLGVLPVEPVVLTFMLNIVVLSLTILLYLKESKRPIKA